MRDFVFHQPESLAEALELLAEFGEDSRLLAGGTALVNLLKQSFVEAEHIISLDRIAHLRGITVGHDAADIGALTRMRDVETSSALRERLPLVPSVYSEVGTVRVRNVATVGGGIAHADPAQDPPAALQVLGASVRLASSKGERTVRISEFFVDYYETAMHPDEMVVELTIPIPAAGVRSTYLKFLPRSVEDYATVGVAAAARADEGVARDVRVALAGAGATSVRSGAVERAMEGRPATAQEIRRAAEAVVDDIDPLDDSRGTASYKRDMAVVFTRRALERVLLAAT